ncbi:DUF3995 domain-containing protein [Paenibacillus sp. 2TAB23]|uniref:DUF3995 domain-containing protein n=1 Tax=Paenibacillus sp. 2TAB23 TaxID=3233004 RepID=UPI003F9E4AC8
MQIILAGIVSSVLLIVGGIHLYWLFGGRSGFAIAVPTKSENKQPFFRPGPIEIAAVIILFWAASILLLIHVEIIPSIGPAWLPAFAGWSLAVVFLIRAIGEFNMLGFFKSIKHTPFARMDTIVYSPLCLLLSGITFWMMAIA